MPGEPVAIVRQGLRGRELALVRWGLIPSWVKDPRDRGDLANARAETVAEKPSFRGALRHRRCLIPADGFYLSAGRKGKRANRLVRPASGGVLALAGLWEHWLGADGSELETMAILTVGHDDAAEGDRWPIALPATAFDRWLDCRSGSAVGLDDLLRGDQGPEWRLQEAEAWVDAASAEGSGAAGDSGPKAAD